MIKVMQIVDTLDAGGMERMAITIANSLPPDRFESHLCTTRRGGTLEQELMDRVRRLDLGRSARFDVQAFHSLLGYVRGQGIQLLHAHGPSLFVSALLKLVDRSISVVWHDHYGAKHVRGRSVWAYRLAVSRIDGIIAVTQDLERWAIDALHYPETRVRYVPNFVGARSEPKAAPALPGVRGKRLVCVANMKPQKGHIHLIEAMAQIVNVVPEAHLLLIGDTGNETYADQVRAEIARHGLGGHVTLLGIRNDVHAILSGCDIGILSSTSEGLPVALIEYGVMGLAAVATDVGQCAEVLGHGRSGKLVPPRDSRALARAVVDLLLNPVEAQRIAVDLRKRVSTVYSVDVGIATICGLYEEIHRQGSWTHR